MCRKVNRVRAAALTLGAMIFVGSGIALAAPQSAPQPDEVVRFGDLNLATPAGVHELANRIQTAAWQVCMNVVPPSSTGPGNIANAQCQETLVKETVDKINNPALTEMFPVAPPTGDDLTSD
jgi:UrcA family protein